MKRFFRLLFTIVCLPFFVMVLLIGLLILGSMALFGALAAIGAFLFEEDES